MGIVAVQETFKGRAGGGDVSSQQVIRRYTRMFLVTVSSIADEAFIVCNAPGLPRPWEPYPNDPTAFCKRMNATQDERTTNLWHVQADYDSEFTPNNPTNEPNPTDREPRVSWKSARIRVPFVQDKNGNQILNSAGDRFGPDIEIDDEHAILTVTRNEASFDGGLAREYVNSVNLDTFAGGSARTWKCNDISAERTSEVVTQPDGSSLIVIYWVVGYEFEYNPKTWDIVILDQGLNRITGGGDKVRIKDPDDYGYGDPQLLNGMGDVQAIGSPAIPLTFRAYQEKAFALLGLPV